MYHDALRLMTELNSRCSLQMLRIQVCTMPGTEARASRMLGKPGNLSSHRASYYAKSSKYSETESFLENIPHSTDMP